MNNIEKLVSALEKNNKKVATMESCTGGALVNEITNIPGASNVLKYSAITYSDEYKIKMGVEKEVIKTFGVYSEETACSMAKHICIFANSDYGVGITGIINKEAYMCVYEKDKDKYHKIYIKLENRTRQENKNIIITCIVNKLNEILDIDS